MNENYNEFEKAIGYSFKDKSLAIKAVTHRSYANEIKKTNIECNERLEFLGDSILSFVISRKLFSSKPKLLEGEMSKLRAMIVCEESLSCSAIGFGLGKYLMLGKGEELSGGRQRASVLADAFEAVVGAIYLDSSLEEADRFINEKLRNTIKKALSGNLFHDYKTKLQEILQQKGNVTIVYELIKETGPAHERHFYMQVLVDGSVFGKGDGKTKKEAEQKAAEKAIKKYYKENK